MSQISLTDEDSECDEWVVDDTNYVREAEQTVYNYNKISIENALVLNQNMRIYLNDLKIELERLLEECKQKYKENEIVLTEKEKIRNEPKLYTTYYFCGYPFFKDRKGGAPPQSAEYLRRSEKGNELFPLDLEKRSVWLPRDKVELIQGVKKQVVTYLQLKNRNRIRQTAGKRCASELTARIENESSSLESMQLKDLLKKTETTDFRINWLNISMCALNERHSTNECAAIWYGYLMPTLNRKPWSPDEEDTLLNAANEHENQDWQEIAKFVTNRSAYQCFVHFQTLFNAKNTQKNVRWAPDQDKRLTECVEKYRIGNIIPWTKVMESCPGRTKTQLYNRYMFSLNPDISRAPFTIAEDCILMAAIKEYGQNYREFPTNLLPGRNMRQIRSRYNNVLKHVNVREHWTEDHDIKLMDLVARYGITEWAKISDELVSHTRTSCRQRYTTIRKFLDKYPDKTVSDVPRRKRAFSTNVTKNNWMESIIDAKNFEAINTASEDEDTRIDTTKKIPQTVAKPTVYNIAYYDFLKYSFNFKFGAPVSGSDSLFENLQIACHLLQAPSIPRQMDISDSSFSNYVQMPEKCRKVQLEGDLLKSLSDLGRNDFSYPVNLNTILGLRSIISMFDSNEMKKQEKKKALVKLEPMTYADHDALHLFRVRFNAIFKQTATLAKMQRDLSLVSVKPRSVKRKIAQTTTTTDFHNNETLIRITTNPLDDTDVDQLNVSESEEIPSKRSRITVLESITVGLNNQNRVYPVQLSQASTSTHPNDTFYKYRVEPTDAVQEIKIQPYISESETEGMISDDPGTTSNNEFVIWTPTVSDDTIA